jgi:hypothetical protein
MTKHVVYESRNDHDRRTHKERRRSEETVMLIIAWFFLITSGANLIRGTIFPIVHWVAVIVSILILLKVRQRRRNRKG